MCIGIQCIAKQVRVLLSSVSCNEDENISIVSVSCLGKVAVKLLCNQKALHTIDGEGAILNFSFYGGHIYLDGRKLKSNDILLESENKFIINKLEYPGSLRIVYIPEKKTTYIISHVDLEDYVASVLYCETYPFWSHESHCMTAVMCRTFAVHKCMERDALRRPYDIHADNKDQHYKGVIDYPAISRAVEDTKGEVLMYADQPVLAMYDICCGGVIPKLCDGFDFVGHPYLARSYPCHHCKDFKSYKWKLEFSHKKTIELFDMYLHEYGLLKDKESVHDCIAIEVLEKARTGALRRVKVLLNIRNSKGKIYKKSYVFDNRTVKKIFKISTRSYSSCFSIHYLKCQKNKSKTLVIEGRGRGHHLGVCQRGAKVKIDNGESYFNVLKFYYPGSSLKKIS